jgi:hypothetical protein
MIAAQVTALQQNNQGRHSTEAAQIARDQMELLQRLPWSHPAVQVSGTWTVPRITSTLVAGATGQPGAAEQQFNTSWRVTGTATPQLRRVDVRVQWVEATQGNAATNRVYVMSALKVDAT